MSLVKDIADFIAAAGLGTVATDIFCGDKPDAPDAAVCIFEYAGESPWTNEDVDRPGLQVWGRAATYEAVRTKMQAVQELLQRVGYPDDAMYYGGFTVNSTRYIRIRPLQGIEPMGRDEQKRFEMAQNYNVIKGR